MKGLTALVTGGSSGIGYATAEALLDAGANVMIVARDGKRLKDSAEKLGEHEGRLKYTTGDVSSEAYANKIVLDTVKAFGTLDILVNNAGVMQQSKILDMAEEEFDYVMGVNLKGTWFMCKFASRYLTKNGGSIVNVSSVLALQGIPGVPSSAYAASKGGVLSLTKSLAIELAPHKVRVNAVVPALVDTPMADTMLGPDSALMKEKTAKRYPAGRVGHPRDVAKAIMYLVDPENTWITGMDLRVDGGIFIT